MLFVDSLFLLLNTKLLRIRTRIGAVIVRNQLIRKQEGSAMMYALELKLIF